MWTSLEVKNLNDVDVIHDLPLIVEYTEAAQPKALFSELLNGFTAISERQKIISLGSNSVLLR